MELLSLPLELICNPSGSVYISHHRNNPANTITWSYAALLPASISCRAIHHELTPLLLLRTKALNIDERLFAYLYIPSSIPLSVCANIETLTLPLSGNGRGNILEMLTHVKLLVLVTQSPRTDPETAEHDLIARATLLYGLYPLDLDKDTSDRMIVLIRFVDPWGAMLPDVDFSRHRITAVIDTTAMELLKVEWRLSRVVTGGVTNTVVQNHGRIETWEDYVEAKKAMEERKQAHDGTAKMLSV